MPAPTGEMLTKIMAENAEMEKEIARLTAGPGTIGMAATKAVGTSDRKVKVKVFGPLNTNQSAGIDNGCDFRPIQCNHRTTSGGFFTS